MGTHRQADSTRGRATAGERGEGEASGTWLMCTAGMEAADTAEWLGELGSDLQGPMASCCFFRKATTFWATAGDSRVNYPSGEKGEAQLRAAPQSTQPQWPEGPPEPALGEPSRPVPELPSWKTRSTLSP